MRPGRRLLVAAGALLLTASLGGLAWRELQRDADAAVAAAVPAVPVSQGLAGAWLTPAVASAPASGAAALSATPASVADAAAGDEVREICGLGRVSKRQALAWSPVEMLKAKAHMDALDRRKDAALSQLSARLAAGSDRERVAARLLMGDIEGAALMATRSRDAAAYRLALLGCGWGARPEAPSCRGLTAQGWAQLAPEDARPWLHRLHTVDMRNEVAAAEAIEQVLRRRPLSANHPLLRTVGGAAGSDDAIGRGLAVTDIIERDAMMFDFGFSTMAGYCRPAMLNAARRERCERIVRWQFEHADNEVDASLTLHVADRLGLPAEQRPYTRAQVQQAQDRLNDEFDQLMRFDCSSIARTADFPARLLARDGALRFLQPMPAR